MYTARLIDRLTVIIPVYNSIYESKYEFNYKSHRHIQYQPSLMIRLYKKAAVPSHHGSRTAAFALNLGFIYT